MNPPQLQHRGSSESQSDGLEYLQEAELFDPSSMPEWQQENYFDETLLLPHHSGEHEKHFLPQLEREESENKRQEIAQDTGKKKPGRKPIMNEPTTKRKAQNRAAQRAFRERKENHVKELETRVHELEQQNLSKSAENEYLKAELARLRSGSIDGNFARSEDFTFAFASPVSMRHQSSSSATGVSPSTEFVTRSGECPSLSSSQTSPQSVVEGDFNAAAMPFFANQPEQTPSLRGSDTTYSTSSLSSASFRRTSGPSSLELQASQPLVPDLFSSPYSFADTKNLPFDPMGYRDTGIFDNYDMDPTLFDTSKDFIDPLQMNTPSDFFLPLSDKSPASYKQQVDPKTDDETTSFGGRGDDRAQPAVVCDEVWRKITAHPKFPIFDLDDLCSEFKTKASCSQRPIKPEDKDWQKFDKDLDEFAARQERKQFV